MAELKYQLDMLEKPIWKFVNESDFAKENLLYIQESGRFCSGKNYYTKRKNLDSFLLLFTTSGKGVLEYCGEKYFMTPNNVMLIDCKNEQNYYTDKNSSKWETSWVHLNGCKAKVYYERYIQKNNGSPVSFLSPDNNVIEIIENIIDISKNYTKNPDNEFIADNLLNTLLKEIIVKTGESHLTTPNYIYETASFLSHNYYEEIDLSLLADKFNISKFHLQRTFTEIMGTSPAKYLTNIRINQAKQLLRGTDLSIIEISEKIGIENNYFIQLFKSHEKVTPMQYRSKWRGS